MTQPPQRPWRACCRAVHVAFAIAGLLLTVLVSPSHATVLRGLDLKELAGRSTNIVAAHPVSSRSEWAWTAGAQRIVTRTRLRVEEGIAGQVAAGQELEVTTLGGTVGDVAQLVLGEAQLKLGESALFFLAPLEQGYRLVGRSQGHYPLVQMPAGVGSPGALARILVSRQLPHLMGPGVPAGSELQGLTLQQARQLILQLRAR
jgi:hypothetical protein